MKTGWAVAIGIVLGLLVAGAIYLASSSPRGEPIQLLPAPTQPPLVVHVSGAVANPGVYALPLNSRVQDALQAAGGLLPASDPQALNLAAFVQDGEWVWVPFRPTEKPPPQPGKTSPPTQAGADAPLPSPTPQFPININTASQAELESLPEIGPVTAQKIIAYREANGPFTSIERIVDVPGIGPATFERIKDLITIGGVP